MATVRVEWDPTPTDMPIDTPDLDHYDNPIGPLFQGDSIHVPEPPVKSILLPANVRASIL